MTSAESANYTVNLGNVGSRTCGIHFLLTKLVASIVRSPVRVSRSISSVLTCVGTRNFSFCSPSRGETSIILTDDIARKRTTGENDDGSRREEERRGEREGSVEEVEEEA